MSRYAKKEGIVEARPFEPGLDDKLVPDGSATPIIGDMVIWDPRNEAEKRIISLGEFEALYVALHHADDDRPRTPEQAQKLAKQREEEQKKLAEAKAKEDAKPEVQAAKGPPNPSGDSRPMTDLGTAQTGGAPATASGQGAKDSDQVKGEKK